MRGIFVVLLISFAGVLIQGQGSGDDYIVITPTSLTATSKAAPPTDATNDSGSGDDDEDYSTGSGASTTAASTLKPTTYTDDDDDDGSGSGSGGFVIPISVVKTVELPTDIYISEFSTPKASTTDVATMASKTAAMTTVSVTDAVTTASASMKTKNVVEATTESPTRATEEKTTTKSVDSTTKAQRETTKVQRETTTPMKENTDVDTTTSAERPSMAHTKSATNPNVLARHDDIEDKGFTLTTEVIAGVVGCALLALLLIAFLMYRLKKRDEGSYLLDDPYDKKMGNSDKEAFV